MRWDAARAASQRRTREYKPVAPVECVFNERYFNKPVKSGPYTSRNGDYIACSGCGYQVCDCDRPSQKLHFTGGGEMLPMRNVETSNKFQFPVKPGFEHGQTAGLPPGSFELGPPPCMLCSGPSPDGIACRACIDKADAEAKPFRDAMDVKIKTLMRHHTYNAMLNYARAIGYPIVLPEDK